MKTYKTEAEINKVYDDHLESLRLSGVEFSESAIEFERERALKNFRDDQTNP